MSLIERAVARLSKDEPPHDAAGGNADRQNTIDVLADRLASGPHLAHAAPTPLPLSQAVPPSVSPPPGAQPVRIHLESLRAAGLVTPSGEQTPTYAQFRVIKRPLVNNAFGRQDRAPLPNGKRVMVTSAFPGEGKTFCAINLAMSIAAERDHQVILIDADVARPSVPRILGIDPGPGLLDWLAEEIPPDIGEFVLPTNVDSLSVLRSGRKHDHATELLASAAMSRLLDTLTARYPDAILIFDTPPLLVTTEARVVASFMGQIVMVVEAGKTPRDSVAEALSTIESCEVIGLVLNKAHKVEKQGYYQGYGYGQLPAT